MCASHACPFKLTVVAGVSGKSNTIMRIALTGFKGSGKDTVGQVLIDEYGFERYGIADPLKEVCRSIFMFDDEQLYGSKKETPDPRWNGMRPRQAFQAIGTNLMHHLDEHIDELKPLFDGKGPWLHRFKMIMDQDPDKRWLITDCRFKHEAEFLRQQGFQIWRIYRDSRADNIDQHPSETEMLEIKEDVLIHNRDNRLTDTLDHVRSLLGLV